MVIYLGNSTRKLHHLNLDVLWVITEILLKSYSKMSGNVSLKISQSKIIMTMSKA